MNIIHIYARNLQMFVDAVKDTDCKLNASKDINYMLRSIQNYNSRDVVGLVVFANPITKKCVQLVKDFDQLHAFRKMPIVIVSDAAVEICEQGLFPVKNSKLFALNSEDNTISDLDISTIFTTILAYSNAVYDLSLCPAERQVRNTGVGKEARQLVMSEQLTVLLKQLEGGSSYETRGTEEG